LVNNRKKVLFICVENSCRSQIAEGIGRHLGSDIFLSYSAGSKPSGKVNPLAIEVMKEIGIDISLNTSKGFNDFITSNFDYVITLGCKDVCPFFPADKHIEWQIDDPKGKGIEYFRVARDTIKHKIEELIIKIRSENQEA